MKKPFTIKDIALALNLSPSTVSRCLSDSYGVSEKTRKIIAEYAKKINYQSSPMAVGTKNRRSYSIGIVVPESANSFFSQAIAGVESIAYENGYHVIITQTHGSSKRELINVNHLAQKSVDGLLISMSSGTSNYSFIKKLYTDGLPIVFFDRVIDGIETFKVISDNINGAFNATLSLIRSGCKKIAFLANAPELSTTNDRLFGYKKALADNHISFRPELVKNCYRGGSDYQEVENAIKELLALPDKPNAIFISSDRIVISCIRALKKLKFNPQEITVVGFSNSDIVNLLLPSISHVKQKAFEMGRTAVEMLLKLIGSNYPITVFETKIFDTELYWKNDGHKNM